MLRIGIPNRSSLLHVAGATACIQGGWIEMYEYHSAKLFYQSGNVAVLLSRCDELCKLLMAGNLDVILTGFDYAEEYLEDISIKIVPFPVFQSHFALLGDVCEPFDRRRVFTKFPRVAARMLKDWGMNGLEIHAMSGGIEGLCAMDACAMAFDIVCTSATVEANKLKIYYRGATGVPSWYFRPELGIETTLTRLIETSLVADLQVFYSERLRTRDMMTRASVFAMKRV